MEASVELKGRGEKEPEDLKRAKDIKLQKKPKKKKPS